MSKRKSTCQRIWGGFRFTVRSTQVVGDGPDSFDGRARSPGVESFLQQSLLPFPLMGEEEVEDLLPVGAVVHHGSVEMDLHVVLDVERNREDELAEMVVEPRELGEIGEVEVYVALVVLRRRVPVPREALREGFDLEEEVLVAKERDSVLGAHYVEADAPLREVGHLTLCRDERTILHDCASKRKMRLKVQVPTAAKSPRAFHTAGSIPHFA